MIQAFTLNSNMGKQKSHEKLLTSKGEFSLDSDKTKRDSEIVAARWRGLATFLIALNVVFLLILFIIAIVWNIEHGQPNPVNKDQVYCIDCSKVNEIGEYEVKDDSSNKQCCGTAKRIMTDLVYRKLEGNYEEEKSRNRFFYSQMHCQVDNSQDRPATRLVGLLHRTESNSNELQWGKNDKLTFRHTNIEYKNGKLVPKIRGTYYLYSQITINLNRTSTSLISHTVYRWRSRNQNMEQLLEGAISNCQLSVNSSDSTSYLGATFMLDANDEITVKITHPAIVKYESYAGNYFGMHKI